jgi:colanic acid/amylovoran biosynthesis protein
MAAKIIEKSDIISFREIYSCNLFKKYSNKNFIKSSDFALYLDDKNRRKSNSDFIVGFTIINWLNKKEQTNLEKSYALALYNLAQQFKIKIQPIIQVNMANSDQHDDLKATKRVLNYLKKYNIKTNKEILINDLDSAFTVYGGIDLLLGMRMHSNIIAATQGVPFVAVSYEHKTEGIARDLGVEKYCIKSEAVSEESLFILLMKAYKRRAELRKTIESSLKKIRRNEIKRWNEIFQSYPSL